METEVLGTGAGTPGRKPGSRTSGIGTWLKTWWPVVTLLVSLLVGYLDYRHKVSDDLNQRKKEYKLNLYEDRKPLYLELCRTTAKIATADRLKRDNEDVRRFLELYYGELCLFETQELEQEAIKFKGQLLRDMDSSEGRPSKDLRIAALRLAGESQKAMQLETVFDIQLSDQTGKLQGDQSLPTEAKIQTR